MLLKKYSEVLGQGNRDLHPSAPVGTVPQMDSAGLKLHGPPGMREAEPKASLRRCIKGIIRPGQRLGREPRTPILDKHATPLSIARNGRHYVLAEAENRRVVKNEV